MSVEPRRLETLTKIPGKDLSSKRVKNSLTANIVPLMSIFGLKRVYNWESFISFPNISGYFSRRFSFPRSTCYTRFSSSVSQIRQRVNAVSLRARWRVNFKDNIKQKALLH